MRSLILFFSCAKIISYPRCQIRKTDSLFLQVLASAALYTYRLMLLFRVAGGTIGRAGQYHFGLDVFLLGL